MRCGQRRQIFWCFGSVLHVPAFSCNVRVFTSTSDEQCGNCRPFYTQLPNFRGQINNLTSHNKLKWSYHIVYLVADPLQSHRLKSPTQTSADTAQLVLCQAWAADMFYGCVSLEKIQYWWQYDTWVFVSILNEFWYQDHNYTIFDTFQANIFSKKKRKKCYHLTKEAHDLKVKCCL